MPERFPVATESEIVNPATMPLQVMTADDRVRKAFYFIVPKGAFFILSNSFRRHIIPEKLI